MSRRLVVIGGSDAGISAGLRARELDPTAEVTVVVADAYPNFSICGIPYHVSGEVTPWQSLAHRTHADLETAGLTLRIDTRATGIDVAGRRVSVTDADGGEDVLAYDELVVGTGAHPAVPAIPGLGGPDGLGPADGVHLLHTIGDTHALMATLTGRPVRSALVVGAGYIGVEMSEALVARGIATTVAQRPAEVLATVDAELGALVRAEMEAHGVEVLTGTTVTGLARADDGRIAVSTSGDRLQRAFDLVVVVAGVRADVSLLVAAGASTGAGGAVVVDDTMATGLPHVWAAGDCVVTHHRLMGVTYLPLGTTAHKQGRVAGANAVGGHARFAGSVGTQVVKVFDLVAARTGLLGHEAVAAGFRPVTTQTSPDDHKAYYPGAQPITIRVTADADTGRLLGAQLVGRLGSEVAKRTDVYATALFHAMTVEGMADLDLAYTPPLGSPWDAVQLAAQAWSREHRPPSIDALPAAPDGTQPGIDAARNQGADLVSDRPSVLFVCVHNAGRSQMAAGWLRHLAGDAVEVRSAGSVPGDQINPSAVTAMAEVGIDISDQRPTVLTTDAVEASDVVITMGCGDACPIFPGKRYLDWALEDPAGKGVESVRPIRDEIEQRIRGLLAELGVSAPA